MPTEVKYMLLWVCTAFALIALVISLWMINVGKLQKQDSASLPNTHAPKQPPAYIHQ